MSWYKIFYWITVADSVKQFFDSTSDLFSWAAGICFVAYCICSIGKANSIAERCISTDEGEKTNSEIRAWSRVQKPARNLFFVMLVLSLLTWTGYVFTPSKKDALIIVAGGAIGNFVSSDSSAKQIPAELTLLVREKLKAEVKELKNPLTDTLAGKSKEELIELLKNK